MEFIPELGMPYRFCPAGIEGREEVTGRIVFIHHAHRYFNVRYPAGDSCLTESIKF